MNEIETKKQKIGNLVWEMWNLHSEPKKTYSVWWGGILEALENWHLSDREKRIEAQENDLSLTISNDKVRYGSRGEKYEEKL